MAATPDLRSKLEQVNSEIAEKRTAAQNAWKSFEDVRDQFAKAGNEANRTDSDEFKKAEEEHKRFATLSDELKQVEQVRDGIFSMLGNDAPKFDDGDTERKQGDRDELIDTKSWGERAVESPEYKQLKESGLLDSDHAHLGNVVLGKRGSVAELKTLLTGAGTTTSAGTFIDPQRQPYVAQPRRPRAVLDLITTGQTSGDAVRYARQTTFSNVAAETAEATATSTGTKPEATMAFEVVNTAVKNIAHWIPATRRALSDVGELRTLIESQLAYGLEYRLESQVVNGDGSGENLTGILNTSNILSQPRSSDSDVDAIHKAITQIRLGFVEPNGVAIHPTNWETIRLSQTTANGYYYGPPSVAGPQTIWGLQAAVTASVPANTVLVGDFNQAVLWLREGVQILASDSHESFFVKNLIALLAEMRAAFGVLLPQAFCKVTSAN